MLTLGEQIRVFANPAPSDTMIILSLLWRLWALVSPWCGPMVEAALPGAARARDVLRKGAPLLVAIAAAGVVLLAVTVGLRTALNHARAAGASAATETADAGWRSRLALARADWLIQQRARDIATQRRVDQARLAWEASLGERVTEIARLEAVLADLPKGGIAYRAPVARALNAGGRK